VYLKAAKYHEKHYDCDDALYTSKVYTVVNLGEVHVKLVAADGDLIEGEECYDIEPMKAVTVQNYKNNYYVIA